MTDQERHDKATEAALAALRALAVMDFSAARLAFTKGKLALETAETPAPHWAEGKGE